MLLFFVLSNISEFFFGKKFGEIGKFSFFFSTVNWTNFSTFWKKGNFFTSQNSKEPCSVYISFFFFFFSPKNQRICDKIFFFPNYFSPNGENLSQKNHCYAYEFDDMALNYWFSPGQLNSVISLAIN
jgi:hypothetical protein